MKIITRFACEKDFTEWAKKVNPGLTRYAKEYDLDTKVIKNRKVIPETRNREWEYVNEMWVDMPRCVNKSIHAWGCIDVTFSDLQQYQTILEQPITLKTRSVWYPKLQWKTHLNAKKWVSDGPKKKYPIYIVSKNRSSRCITARALDRMNTDYRVIVEKDQLEDYAKYIDRNKLIVLPQKYLDEYDTCDNVVGKSKGPGAARNFAWDLSKDYKRHWVMDDNIDFFAIFDNNQKIRVYSETAFRVMEDFTDRYSNIAISGPNYYKFCKETDACPPFITNTRIYSCLLINNSYPGRWRGRYNEDTDLSLCALKKRWCTIQFNYVLQDKITTQRMKGGNTDEFYEKEGTRLKSEMIAELHPDVAQVKWKFNRWHHEVNYAVFKTKPLLDRVVPTDYRLQLRNSSDNE